MTKIGLWSGSRTSVRRNHEREVLQAALNHTKSEFGNWEVIESTVDYPGSMEAGTFREFGHDVFATIAGNRKLEQENKIIVYKPIMRGIMGYRVLIIREQDEHLFSDIAGETELKEFRIGIPETWSDAEFYRFNGYKVEEKGTYDDVFERLRNKEFDFTALGANEIEDVFHERNSDVNGLKMVNHLLLFFPFPVVFYVNPSKPELAARIEKGMSTIENNGLLYQIFLKYNAGCIQRLKLTERIQFNLKNPILPKELSGFKSDIDFY